MGSGAGGYVRITLSTLRSFYDEKTGQLSRVSELAFRGEDVPTGGVPKDLDTTPAGPPPGPMPAGKLGLGGVRASEVERFRLFGRTDDDGLLGLGVTPDRTITRELAHAFGGRWAGFAVAVAPTGTRFRLIADITMKPCWKRRASRPFQVIPIVMAFGTDRFVDHYLLAVIAAQETVELVGTSVVQPYR